MLDIRSSLCFTLYWVLASSLLGTVEAQNRGNGRQTPQQQAASVPQGISKATDGSTILDTTATVNGVQLRYRVSGPVNMFTTLSNVTGGTAAPGTQGTMGLNVLLHGDGGQSFFDFPNQAVQGNLMGVVVLAPSESLLWGTRKGPPGGLARVDGVADSQAINDLVKNVLPQVVAFNSSNVFFTGVSGGSLTLSGYFVPAHMADYAGTGVLLMCGGMPPQVAIKSPQAFLGNTRIHYQSSKQELTMLQTSIPRGIKAYEQAAITAGVSTAQLAKLQTVDNTPNGGHCAFDERDYSSGIQLFSNSFSNVMQGGDGVVKGIKAQTVLTPVVGHENLAFGAGTRKRSKSWAASSQAWPGTRFLPRRIKVT